MSDGRRRVQGLDAFDRPANLEVDADDDGKVVLIAPAPGTWRVDPEELPYLHHVLDDAGERALRRKPPS